MVVFGTLCSTSGSNERLAWSGTNNALRSSGVRCLKDERADERVKRGDDGMDGQERHRTPRSFGGGKRARGRSKGGRPVSTYLRLVRVLLLPILPIVHETSTRHPHDVLMMSSSSTQRERKLETKMQSMQTCRRWDAAGQRLRRL